MTQPTNATAAPSSKAEAPPAAGRLETAAPRPSKSSNHSGPSGSSRSSGPATAAPAQRKPASRLSVSQMLSVMRVEFHRARVQRYPLCCLMVAVDGLEELRGKSGWAAKDEAVRAAYDLLKDLARERAQIGMALRSGDRIMAVFPNLAPAKLADFAAALNARDRALALGASHNLLAETNSSFEGLVEMAGRALKLAVGAAGERYVMWRATEAEIDLLREELAATVRSFREEEALLREESSEVGGLQQAALVDRIQAIFAEFARTPETEALEKKIIALAVEELYEGRRKAVAAQMAEHARQVDVLERRIAKLTAILGVTEEELQRVMALKHVDEGVASIYREVQGLSPDAAQAQAKRAMMAEIFRENLAFQKPGEAAAAA